MTLIVNAFQFGSDGRYYVEQDPVAVLDYAVDWTDYLAAIDDTIASSTWQSSVGLSASAPGQDGGINSIWLAAPGSAIGDRFEASNIITTVGGRTDRRTFRVEIRQR